MATLVRNGVKLAYEELGSGSPAVMLVHAWGGDRTWMRPLAERLATRYRVISVDLRGYGESDKPEGPYPFTGFVDDLAWMATELRLERPVLVGHSLGAGVVLEAASRNFASAIVMLEAMVLTRSWVAAEFKPLFDALNGPHFTAALAQMTKQLCGPYMEARDRDAIVAKITSNPQHVMVGTAAGVGGDDGSGAASRCKLPALYVATGTPYVDLERFKSLTPTLVTAQVVGCGHYFPIEVPEQVYPIVARFIATHVAHP